MTLGDALTQPSPASDPACPAALAGATRAVSALAGGASGPCTDWRAAWPGWRDAAAVLAREADRLSTAERTSVARTRAGALWSALHHADRCWEADTARARAAVRAAIGGRR